MAKLSEHKMAIVNINVYELNPLRYLRARLQILEEPRPGQLRQCCSSLQHYWEKELRSQAHHGP